MTVITGPPTRGVPKSHQHRAYGARLLGFPLSFPAQARRNVRDLHLAFCPFCIRAKPCSIAKGVPYPEFAITGDNAARSAMRERARGAKAMPQIFIDTRGIGGSHELHA